MDFAPYQDTDPAATRALSPPPQANRALSPQSKLRQATRSPPLANNAPRGAVDAFGTSTTPLPAPSSFAEDDVSGYQSGTALEGGGIGSRRADANLFETSLPLRLDYESMLAYLLLPPAGGVLLLVLEHRSDYVRFHAWQSSLLFAAIFILHLILSWSAVLSWMLFAIDLCIIGFLTFHAYRDADTLDRFEIPFFGGLASSFVDSE